MCKSHERFCKQHPAESLTAELYREQRKRRNELLWTALLHDIGKGRSGGGHSERGAAIATRVLKNMGYPDKTTDTVSFLIEHHLFLIKTATRRDIGDEETAVYCARRIKSIPRLKMLYLLTVADSAATGPKAWNDWSAELLRDLFFKTLKILQKGELASTQAVATVKRKKEAVQAAAASEEEAALLKAHLEILSPRYLLYINKTAIIEHMRLFHRLGDRPFVWKIHRGRNADTRRVTICAENRPGLFSKIAGVFALNGLDVLEAEIHTWKNENVLDLFTVRPPADLIYENARWEKAGRHLSAAIAGELDPAAHLPTTPADDRPNRYCGRRPGRLEIDNQTSSFFTIMEIFSDDCPGLLFFLTDILFRHRLDIRVAKIATKVDQVVDVFYVKDTDGRKIDRPEKLAALRADIEMLLSDPSPAGALPNKAS